MSNTVRRKRFPPQWCKTNNDKMFWYFCEKSGAFNAPKGYKKFLNKQKKNRNIEELRKELWIDGYDPVYTPFKKDANWNYW